MWYCLIDQIVLLSGRPVVLTEPVASQVIVACLSLSIQFSSSG